MKRLSVILFPMCAWMAVAMRKLPAKHVEMKYIPTPFLDLAI